MDKLVLLSLLSIQGSSGTESAGSDLKNGMKDFLSRADFHGATYGLMAGDRLVSAEGEGHVRGHNAHPGSLLPILGFSKLLTAAAILQLVDEGDIKLTDHVFGNHGILYYIRPENDQLMDPRLRDITIEDLLYETAGWDETLGPVYDPMLNAYYVRNGYDVVDISRQMEVYGILSQDDIMRFMVTQQLDFDPGTQRVESSFGYCVLGRVIEKITDMSYDDYIKAAILTPNGMWHTRIGPTYSETHQARETGHEPGRPPRMGYIPLDNSNIKSLFDIVPPMVLDSCLGWHSNIYDLSRFFASLFLAGDDGILDVNTLRDVILEPAFTPDFKSRVLDGIGISIDDFGAMWYSTFHPDIGVHAAFYYQGTPQWVDNPTINIGEDDLAGIIIGISTDTMPELVEELARWVEAQNPYDIPDSFDAYTKDLADTHLIVQNHECMVAYEVDEHHILGYVNALQLAEYVPKWIQGYRDGPHTRFVIVSEKAIEDEDLDYLILIRSSKDHIISDIMDEVKEGYQVSFLDTYSSVAHDEKLCHLAIMHQEKYPVGVEFDLVANLDIYFQNVEEGLNDGFLPAVQSVDVLNGDVSVTYLLRDVDHHQNVDRQKNIAESPVTYVDLSINLLEEAIKDNNEQGYVLSYLDSFTAHGEIRFSAVFTRKKTNDVWFIKTNVSLDDISSEMKQWESIGYIPEIIVGYTGKHGLSFVILWKGVFLK